ncbi:MAG: hypothetical protein RLZZ495_933 [Pseudomonadota bacterium]|jgi:hypothetical protein
MKLHINPARQGFQWAKLGVKTFFRQPLALSGLFFMFLALMSVVSRIPLIGTVVALMLLPGITLGLMIAAREAHDGKFPMPLILFSAFRAGQEKLQAMLMLGGIYALGFLMVMGICTLVGDDQFANLYLNGGAINAEIMEDPDFQASMWTASVLFLPLSMLFWHAPALTYWHGISPIKSLFFSFFACLKNWKSLTMYGLTWVGFFLGLAIGVALLGSLVGSPSFIVVASLASTLLLVAGFFVSIYFSFADSFVADFASGDDHAA